MRLITPTNTLADVLLLNNGLIAVVERLGMELGMGDMSIRDVCVKHKVDVDFCCALLNTLGTEHYYPEQPLSTQGALHLVEYLRKTHEHYRRTQLRIIQAHVARLVASSTNPNKQLQVVEQTFGELHQELLQYFTKIEEQLFTHVQSLYDSCVRQAAGQVQPDEQSTAINFFDLQQRYHTIMLKAKEIRTLLIKYLSGEFDRTLRNAVIFHISGLENDLRNLLNSQEQLLLPAMLSMRNSLTNKKLEEIYRYTSQTVDIADGKELSEREREVLTLVAQGLSSSEIANRLHISLHTVQAHRKNITAKLGIKTVPGLTTYAIMHGIISPK